MARVGTHILDLAEGRPAVGVTVSLVRLPDESDPPEDPLVLVKRTDGDGRCVLAEEGLPSGIYELRFQVGDHLRGKNEDSTFLDMVPVRFRLEEGERYHIPLLLSPFGYSTYRGS